MSLEAAMQRWYDDPDTGVRYLICQRCDESTFRAEFAARSRTDQTLLICPTCGTDEAVRDLMGLSPIPFSEWPVRPEYGEAVRRVAFGAR